jgi:hypothetical protein
MPLLSSKILWILLVKLRSSLGDGDLLIRFDVVSLFTMVLFKEAVDITSKIVPIGDIINLVKICLQCTFLASRLRSMNKLKATPQLVRLYPQLSLTFSWKKLKLKPLILLILNLSVGFDMLMILL